MQEEVENRTVNLVITTGKLSLRALVTILKKYLDHRKGKKLEKQAVKKAESAKKPTGRQTVQELIGQNQGVTSVDISKTDLRGFEKYARKFGIDYAVYKDRSVKPDKYLVFFKARDADALNAAVNAYTADTLRIPSKESVLKRLEQMKKLVAAAPKKIKELSHGAPER